MSVQLGASATTDRVEIGASPTINDLATFSILAWIFPTTFAGGKMIYASRNVAAGASAIQLRFSDALGNFTFRVAQTTGVVYTTTGAPLILNQWNLVVATYDNNAGTPLNHLYTANLYTPPSETSYAVTTAGTGARTAEGGNNHQWGNRIVTSAPTFDSAIQGRFGWGQIYNRVLTLAEIKMLWNNRDLMLAGCVHFIKFDENQTGSLKDLSGRQTHGTILGSTIYAPAFAERNGPFRKARFSKVAAGGSFSQTLTDTVTISDSLTRFIQKVLSETISITDSLIKSITRAFVETVTMTDNLGILKVFVKVLSDTVTVTDTFLRSIFKLLTETVTSTDSLVKQTSKKLNTETVTTTDTLLRTVSKTFSEIITTTGSLLKQVTKQLTEALTLADTLTKTISKVLTETITLSDILVALKNLVTYTYKVTVAAMKGLYPIRKTILLSARSFVVKSIKPASKAIRQFTRSFVVKGGKRSNVIKKDK